jgi:hypothetical protein
MQLLTVILSSAVISSIVTIILGYVFENKRYLKEKKLLVYTEFLEQLDKMFPAEEIFGDTPKETMIRKMKVEASNLEKYIWKIKLISQNKNIHALADDLFEISEKLTDALSSDMDDKELEAIIEKSGLLQESLIEEMNRDISKF